MMNPDSYHFLTIVRKTVQVIVLLLLTGCISYQPITYTEDEYPTAIFDDLDTDKAGLYLKANEWMVEAFTSAKSVIQHQDKEEGVIIGKYLLHSYSNGMAVAEYFAIIDIRVKDQKSKIVIKPTGEWKFGSGTIYNYPKGEATRDMNRLIESFHKHLLSKTKDF